MLATLITLWLIASFPLGILTGRIIRGANAREQTPHAFEVTDPVARREQPESISDLDLKPIHIGSTITGAK